MHTRDIKVNFRYTIKVNVNATAARTMKGERINEKQIDKKSSEVGIEVDICTIAALCCRQGLNWKFATCSGFIENATHDLRKFLISFKFVNRLSSSFKLNEH